MLAIIGIIAITIVNLTTPAQGRALLAASTPVPRELFEPVVIPSLPAQDATPRADPSQLVPVAVPTPTVALRRSTGVRGTATWYCQPGVSRCTKGWAAGCYCAAAGPELRAALGDWRGRMVMVTNGAGDRGVWVKLIDSCACGGDHVIDLYAVAFAALGSNGENVEVSW